MAPFLLKSYIIFRMIRIINHIRPSATLQPPKYKTLRPITPPINFPLPKALVFYFSKQKKEKPQLKVPTIHISKLNQEYDGFVLYQNQEGIRLKTISIAFLLCFISGYWTYSKIQDDQIKVNYLILGAVLAVPFLIFQIRTGKTLKRLVLDKQGENIVLTRFQYGGLSEENTKARVQVLKGIGKAFVFGGSVIKGGGVYGLEERNYWFQSKYIVEPETFQEVAQGRKVKVDRNKIY